MIKITKLSGANIAGGNPKNSRADLDYYATNPKAVEMLLDAHGFKGKSILEPCVGAGHIANVLTDRFGGQITALDIVDRGYQNTIITDFLKWETNKRFDTIITNPPYTLASEFIERCMELLAPQGQLAMFLKIQFLEGLKRKPLFDKYPPKYIYVFRKRMCTFSNGQETNPDTGKSWVTTMCNAWYIWEKDYKGEPIIKWL